VPQPAPHPTKEGSVQGTLIWFTPAKHHGFIRTEDGERLLVEEGGFAPGHLVGDRCGGTPVSFQRIGEGTTAKAVEVCIVTAEPPRRARLRHR
jgi:hypothetical protein